MDRIKIHLALIGTADILPLLLDRARQSANSTTDDPEEAELILLAGNFGRFPKLLLDHPLYRRYADKVAVYTEDDIYLPLVPGVYCSAQIDEHSHAGRTFSYSYITRNGSCSNPFIGVSNATTEKKLLFSFQGGSTSMLRKRLFKRAWNRSDVVIENTSSYHHWDVNQPGREDRQQHYASTVASSHFVLCPRGAGAGSIRLFEVMSAGVAPVLISDSYLLPPDIDWDSFLLRIPEKDIDRLPRLLASHVATSAERGRIAQSTWLQHFAPEREFDAIISHCFAALRHGPPSEEYFLARQAQMISSLERRRRVRNLARAIALKTLKVLHIESPYQMNR